VTPLHIPIARAGMSKTLRTEDSSKRFRLSPTCPRPLASMPRASPVSVCLHGRGCGWRAAERAELADVCVVVIYVGSDVLDCVNHLFGESGMAARGQLHAYT
jgi:hypothetical protein